MACAMAVRVVDEGKVEVGDAEAAARSRRAMERCTRKAGFTHFVLFFMGANEKTPREKAAQKEKHAERGRARLNRQSWCLNPPNNNTPGGRAKKKGALALRRCVLYCS